MNELVKVNVMLTPLVRDGERSAFRMTANDAVFAIRRVK